MSELKHMTTDKLQKLAADTQELLDELKEELERRHEAEQHEEVDQLGEHLKNTEFSLRTIRDFLAYLAEQMKSPK